MKDLCDRLAPIFAEVLLLDEAGDAQPMLATEWEQLDAKRWRGWRRSDTRKWSLPDISAGRRPRLRRSSRRTTSRRRQVTSALT